MGEAFRNLSNEAFKSVTVILRLVLSLGIIWGTCAPALGQARRGGARPSAPTRAGGAQTGAGAQAASAPASSAAACRGGWRGVITYTKTLKDSLQSDEPGIRKAKDRIRHRTSRDYRYSGRVVVEEGERGSAVTTASVSFADADRNWGEERVWDTCGSRESGHWFINESVDDRMTEATGTGAAEYFNLRVNEAAGTYGFSFRFPKAAGTYRREQRIRRSGHCQPKNNEPYDKSENRPTTIEGESVQIDDGKFDPRRPEHLSGSKTWDTSSGRIKSFVYTVTWRFTRCPQKLLITELKFEHPKFPDFGNWQEIVEQVGTIDGNRVRIKAKVLNLGGETKYADLRLSETYKGDKWNGARPDEPLPDGVASLRLDPGEEREVELVWDTAGQSWFDDGRPHLTHRIKAEVQEAGKPVDTRIENLKIAPKPLVLVHGLWSSAEAWSPYQNYMTTAHSYDWKAFAVGERPERGRMNTGGTFLSSEKTNGIFENAQELGKYIRYAQEDRNAWHVDLVAHSMGGLISRFYIHSFMPESPDGRPLVSHLVMLGTPNMGSPCADVMNLKFELFGQHVEAVRQLRPSVVEEFNRTVTNNKGVKFSALAGDPLPVMCKTVEWNDGVVTVSSAHHGVGDRAKSKNVHTELTGAADFSDFVLKRVAVGPRGDHRPAPPSRTSAAPASEEVDAPFAQLFVKASYGARTAPRTSQGSGPAASDSASSPTRFSKELKLAPRQKTEVEIPVEQAPNLGVTFMAGAGVSAVLVDERGAVVGKSLANTPEAKGIFRSIYFDRPVRGGVWKLRLENSTAFDAVVLLAVW
jgi:triacylglycerol esterase/lipase EstA (alpha/beta hydrolase family)